MSLNEFHQWFPLWGCRKGFVPQCDGCGEAKQRIREPSLHPNCAGQSVVYASIISVEY